MSNLSKDEYIEKVADLVDRHFPKGECKERGEAMVLISDILLYLMEEGAIADV